MEEKEGGNASCVKHAGVVQCNAISFEGAMRRRFGAAAASHRGGELELICGRGRRARSGSVFCHLRTARARTRGRSSPNLYSYEAAAMDFVDAACAGASARWRAVSATTVVVADITAVSAQKCGRARPGCGQVSEPK